MFFKTYWSLRHGFKVEYYTCTCIQCTCTFLNVHLWNFIEMWIQYVRNIFCLNISQMTVHCSPVTHRWAIPWYCCDQKQHKSTTTLTATSWQAQLWMKEHPMEETQVVALGDSIYCHKYSWSHVAWAGASATPNNKNTCTCTYSVTHVHKRYDANLVLWSSHKFTHGQGQI